MPQVSITTFITLLVLTVMSMIISVLLYVVLQKRIQYLRKENQKLLVSLSRKRNLLKRSHLDLSFLKRGFKIDSRQLELKRKVAEGATGAVWKGVLNKQWDVAVKIFHRAKSTEKIAPQSEIEFLMRTRHQRLVMFVGMGTLEETGQKFMVSEYCECGALSTKLWSESIPWIQSLQLLSDIAEGLAYLHLMHKSVHCDLKSPNVMLINEGIWLRAKLADFSHSKIVYSGKRKTPTSSQKIESKKEAVHAASWKRRGTFGCFCHSIMMI